MKTGQGGYLEDLENAYLYAFLNAPSGPLVVIRAQAFSYPDTFAGAPVMPSGKDMRYWSVCSYDPVSQRNYACTPDFRAAPQGGAYTIVVSTPANKPPQLCGAIWLPFGPAAQSLLIFRNQLGSSPYSVQKVQLGHETAMGAYYPAAHYMDQAAYKGQVCGISDAATTTPDNTAAPSGDQVPNGGDVPPADLGWGGGYAGFDIGGALPADAAAPSADGSAGPPGDSGMDVTEGAVLAATARAQREPTGNLPLGLSLAALVLGTLGIGVRRKLAA